MQISKISFIPKVMRQTELTSKQEQKNTRENYLSDKISNFSYQDYNITFGERLFRTPANFYAQAFNKKNMPLSMKTYLNADYEDRQNIPPAQMMKIVFDDLNNINSLDFVPRVESFKDEPLFKDLTDTPKRNARTGLVYEIETLKSEMFDTPLFKDGTSNLGMYLLKKIYLEGKILSEINKDFKNDISEDYKDLITSEIDYSTTSAYGIKFPNKPFWKSFVATRDDFPYVYKPRKNKNGELVKNSEKSIAALNKKYASEEDKMPPKFDTKKGFEKKGKMMADAIVNAHGDRKKIEKELRHKGITDKEEISFISKYFSQIMSIALEKIHASEEMRNYFESYDAMTKKQRQKMEGYWKENPFMREYQSLAISDTIKLFCEAYGADGNNDEFKGLLEYAAQIKPNRKYRDEVHNQRQKELEEAFENYDYERLQSEITAASAGETFLSKRAKLPYERPNVTLSDDIDKFVNEFAKQNNAEVLDLVGANGKKYKYIANINELFFQKISEDFRLLPKGIIDKYSRYAIKSKYATPEFKKTVAIIDRVDENVREHLLPFETCKAISAKINDEFATKYPSHTLAAEEALAERLLTRLGTFHDFLLACKMIPLLELAKLDDVNIRNWTVEERQALDAAYQRYLPPISTKEEEQELTAEFLKYLDKINPNTLQNSQENDSLNEICALFIATIKQSKDANSKFVKSIRQSHFIKDFGGTARALKNPDISEEIKIAKAKQMLSEICRTKVSEMLVILAEDKDLISTYIADPRLKMTLFQYNNIRKHLGL